MAENTKPKVIWHGTPKLSAETIKAVARLLVSHVEGERAAKGR